VDIPPTTPATPAAGATSDQPQTQATQTTPAQTTSDDSGWIDIPETQTGTQTDKTDKTDQTLKTDQTPKGPSVEGFISNTGRSFGNYFVNTWNALKNGEDTTQNIIDLLRGTGRWVLRNAGPAHAGWNLPHNQEDQALDNFKDYVVSRYGGIDQLSHSLYTDPVGVASDVSTLFSGVGAAADAANLGRLGKIATTAGELANPLGIPTKVAGWALGKFMPKAVPTVQAFDPSDVSFSQHAPESVRDLEAEKAADVQFKAAVRQRAYDISGMRPPTGARFEGPLQMPSEENWLKAEQEVRAQQAKANAPPAAQAANNTIFQNVRKVLTPFAKSGIAGGTADLLAHYLTGHVTGGHLLGGAIAGIPLFLKSPVGQRMLTTMGPGTDAAKVAATVRNMVPALNTLYRQQLQARQGPITVLEQAKGGAVRDYPELDRIQRERLPFIGIHRMLAR
jgi:hypothetical protein